MFEKLARKLNIKSTKTLKMLLFCAIGIIIAFAIMFINDLNRSATEIQRLDAPEPEIEIETRGYAATQPQIIMVYVSGAVYNPDVYELYEGARVRDAINAAGGMTADADPNAINLSARVVDEQHIIVFSLADNMPPTTQATSGTNDGGMININTATSEQLQQLNNVGPVTAANIISHREARGGFGSIEEIMNVSGIGERTFEGIRDRITTE